MAQPYQLVVDLGTCHTVAVVRRAGEQPRPVLFDGSPLLGSGVYRSEDGTMSVGRDAERFSVLSPSRFEPYPKRCIDDGSVLLGDAPVPVAELLAAVLRRVRAEVGRDGQAVGQLTLTCPADWGPRRREVLLAAARSAGLTPDAAGPVPGAPGGGVRLVDEPIAAATYCVEVLGQQVPPGSSLLVFDFGGGTLDVTVVRREPAGPPTPAAPNQAGLRVLAVGGLDDLGGVDVDAALVGHLGQLIALRSAEVWRRLSEPQSTADMRDRRTLWDQVRGAKEMLSRVASAPVPVPGLDDAMHLTREELDRIAGPLVDRAVDECRRVLDRAGVANGSPSAPAGGSAPAAGSATAGSLAGILLVGGSSRIPLVASRLHARFGVAPTVPEQPELPVAYGGLLVGGTVPGVGGGGAAPVAGGRPRGVAGVSGRLPAPTSPVSAAPIGVPMPAGPAGASPSYPVSAQPVPSPTTGTPFPPSGAPGQPGGFGSPFPPPGFPGPRTGPPGPPAWSPPGANRPPGPGVHARKSPRAGARRAVTAGAIVVAILLGVGFGVRALWNAIGSAVSNAAGAVGAPGIGGGGGSGGGLDSFGDSPIALGTVAAAAVGRGSVFYAVVKDGHTEVHAIKAPGGGGVRWDSSAPVEPSELHLTVVGDLLVINASASASDNNRDTRAVLDATTGSFLWKGDWRSHTDLAYLGDSAIVALDSGGDVQTQRVDLRTGARTWTHTTGAFIQYHPAKPVLTWKATAGRVPAAAAGTFQESLGVDATSLVELDSENQRAAVVNPATGRVRISGTVPIADDLDNTTWVAFDGLVMGKATEGRPAVIAYGLDNLRRRWQYDLPAGGTVSHIGACADHVVCVAAEVNSAFQVMAVDTRTGKAKWGAPLTAKFSADPGWYVLGGRMVYGENTFPDVLGGPDAGLSIVDVGSGQARSLANGFISMRAGSGSYGVVTAAGPSGYKASVYDVATGKQSGTIDVGGLSSLPQPAISGTTIAVVSNNNLYLANAAGLGSQ